MMKIDIKNIWTYLKLSLFQCILFSTIYGVTNYLSQCHFYSTRFYFDFELLIPLFPPAIVVYFSLNILMLLPMFMMNENQMKGLSRVMTYSTLLAGLIFLIFPAPCGFVRTPVTGPVGSFFENLYKVDFNGNTFPSLHITFSYIFSRILVMTNPRTKWFFAIWFLLMCLAVLLTHQHHLLDILGGLLLGEFCLRKYYVSK